MAQLISGTTPTVVSARKRRFFTRRKIVLLIFIPVMLVGLGIVGIGAYFSNVLLIPTNGPKTYTTLVKAVGSQTVTLEQTNDTLYQGTYGFTWPGGQAIVGEVISKDATSVTRNLLKVEGDLTAGTKVAWNTDVYEGASQNLLGLAIENVTYPDPLGAMPALYVAGSGTNSATWVIIVHGLGGTIGDGLKTMPTLAAQGVSILDIKYRNDAGAPASPDGYYHLGDTEWQDLEASVKYAVAHGAQHVVLYGYSMGGEVVMTFMHRSSYAHLVKALVLDAPVLNWYIVLDHQAELRRLPSWISHVCAAIATTRSGINFDSLNQFAQDQPDVPILLFHGTADNTVPIASSDAYALAHPNNVIYYKVLGARHIQAWNANPTAYEGELNGFLSRVLR
jgi:alpha-beta hydrolase superfamily lysophospholipase